MALTLADPMRARLLVGAAPGAPAVEGPFCLEPRQACRAVGGGSAPAGAAGGGGGGARRGRWRRGGAGGAGWANVGGGGASTGAGGAEAGVAAGAQAKGPSGWTMRETGGPPAAGAVYSTVPGTSAGRAGCAGWGAAVA